MISKRELKFIRSLKIKKYRTAEKCFLVEGEKNVLELLDADYKIRRLLVTKGFLDRYSKNIDFLPFEVVKPKELTEVSSLVTNNQALAVVEMEIKSIEDLDLSSQIFVLDGIRDPGNLGSIIRTLDWFGFDQLVCSEDTAELFNPKVISATMGSFMRVKVVYCDLRKLLSVYDGIKIGAEMAGKVIEDFRKIKQKMIVLGSESHGISEPIKLLLDDSVLIPKHGGAESLNVGVATGILCHALTSE